MVNDFCKGFAGYVDEELIKALMVLLDSDFSTVQKSASSEFKRMVRCVNTDVQSFDMDDSKVFDNLFTFGREKLLG